MTRGQRDRRDCPDAFELIDLAAGGSVAAAVLGHVESCQMCMQELRLARALHEDAVRLEAANPPPPADIMYFHVMRELREREVARARSVLEVWSRLVTFAGVALAVWLAASGFDGGWLARATESLPAIPDVDSGRAVGLSVLVVVLSFSMLKLRVSIADG